MRQTTVMQRYTPSKVAALFDKAEHTVRDYCRRGQTKATRKPCGQGKGGVWLISHELLERLRNFGPAPEPYRWIGSWPRGS